VTPFRVFGSTAYEGRVAAAPHPLVEFTRRSEYCASAVYRGYGFARPLRRWPFPRPCGFPEANACRAKFPKPTHPLFDFSVPPECYPVSPSHRHRLRGTAGSSRGLFAPFNTCRQRGSTFRGARPPRYVPPPGFGHPPGGLLPPKPGRACFIPTAFLGFFPSELSPSARWPLRFHNRRTRVPLTRRDLLRARLADRCAAPRLPGFGPYGSPWRHRWRLTCEPLDAPLGFTPSRVSHQAPWADFRPPLPLRASRNAAAPTAAPPAP